jgi:hypothetical protein
VKQQAAGFLADHGKVDQPEAKVDASLSTYERIGTELGKLVQDKNLAYGPAAKTSGQMLRLLFPQGCHPSRFDDLLLIARMWDKLSRIATRPDAFGESPYKDIAGYAIIGAAKDEVFEKKEDKPCPQVGEKV